MFLIILMVTILLISVLLYNYFKERESKTPILISIISISVSSITLLILFVIIIIVHMPTRNENFKHEDEMRRTILENRMIDLDRRDTFGEEDLKFYRGTVRNIKEFNANLKRKQDISNGVWLNWLVEPYVNEIEIIDLTAYRCYIKYGED